jgi:phosphoribosylformylglycinamidine synthase I
MSTLTATVRAVVLAAPGTNRDLDTAFALERAGAAPEVISVLAARREPRRLRNAGLVVVAGGFSYADALGSGRLFALDLTAFLLEELTALRDAGRPILGICNGFQTLVRAGLLPGPAALGPNESGRFECRWTTLVPRSRRCVWTASLEEPILAPIAHGEGRYVVDQTTYADLLATDRVALTYGSPNGIDADGVYPTNPNGSAFDIAGVCDVGGTVLGLMPHPENHVVARQHPRHTRGETGGSGLALFMNGVRHARAA